MRPMRFLAALATTTALVVANGAAQGTDVCGEQMRVPPIGGWAQYQITGQEGQTGYRMAMLGTEDREGKPMVRLEMSLNSERGAMVMQMVVPGYPYDPSQIQEIVMKAGNQPAMRISGNMMSMFRSRMGNNPGNSAAEACQGVAFVGAETITVPGGTFPTRHYRDEAKGTDVWVSRELPFGLVKLVSRDNHQILLAGQGHDAKSSITETPMDMPMRQ